MNEKKLPRGVFWRNDAFWIRYADQMGRIHREKVGPFLKQATSAYQKRKSEVREGKFFPEKVNARVIVCFAEVAKDFLARSKQTKRSYGHDVGRMENLLRLWREAPITDLSVGRVERDLAALAEQDEWSPATYNRYRALVSGVFSLAIRNGKAQVNPVRGSKHRIENNVRVRYLTDEEETRLLALTRENWPGREPEITTALHSGMRRSEQYVTRDCPDGGLKWEYIDFRTSVVTLPRSKHGESRHIPMNSRLRETLRRLHQTASSPYVFPVDPPDKWFPEVCEQTGITDFTWHCLRHTFASRLVMAGVDLRTVQELMGHKSYATTIRYAHLAPQHQADAVERLVKSTSTATSTRPSKARNADDQSVWQTIERIGAEGRTRTGTTLAGRGILSPLRLPVPPPPHIANKPVTPQSQFRPHQV